MMNDLATTRRKALGSIGATMAQEAGMDSAAEALRQTFTAGLDSVRITSPNQDFATDIASMMARMDMFDAYQEQTARPEAEAAANLTEATRPANVTTFRKAPSPELNNG